MMQSPSEYPLEFPVIPAQATSVGPYVVLPKLAAVLCGIACAFSLAWSQTSAPVPRRDARAVETIKTAIDSMQGGSPPSAVRYAASDGTVLLLSEDGQTREDRSFHNVDEYVAGSWSFIHETKGSVHSSTWSSDAEGTRVSLDGADHKLNTRFLSSRRTPFYLPSVILQQAINTPSLTIVDCGLETVRGVAQEHVRLIPAVNGRANVDDAQDWFFDPKSHLPTEVDHPISIGPTARVKHYRRVLLSNITLIKGISVATDSIEYRDDAPIEAIQIRALSLTPPSISQGDGGKQ